MSVDKVKASIDAAEEVKPPTPVAGELSNKGGKRLPDDCPVTPLGISGDIHYYLDAARQLRPVEAGKHGRLAIISLFGEKAPKLYAYWPRHNKEGEIQGWRPEHAAEALMAVSAGRGPWDPMDKVRGPGGWLAEDGSLVLHAGNAIYSNGAWQPPGQIGRRVYPAAPAMPRPSDRASKDVARELLSLLNTWSWTRGEIDATLLLGWIGAAMLGGAIDWRPLIWITGDRATGKSTLHKLVRMIFGEAILSVSDASAAGIWQKLGHASLPVALDELEAEEDNRKAQNVIKLARQAASGGVVLRGGADHQGAEFIARSCFLFSSILLPPLLGQDRSRMAILELNPLTDAKPPTLVSDKIIALGSQLRRRLVDGWARWPTTVETYRMQLASAGHTGRSADQFGTLLAAADLLLHDHAPSGDELAGWAEKLKHDKLAEAQDDAADHERCCAHLATSILDVYRSGQRRVVGDWIAEAAGRYSRQEADLAGNTEATNALGAMGLRYEKDVKANLEWVAVANSHQGLAQIFAGTHWAARSGASGVWVQALRRVPGAMPGDGRRFAGVYARCTLLPLAALLDPATMTREHGVAPGEGAG